VSVLDNAVWHALHGPHRDFAHVAENGKAARYPTDVAFFGALPDEAGPDAWAALAQLIGPGKATSLFRDEVTPAPGWEVLMEIPTVQMVLDGGPAASLSVAEPPFADLAPADVDEMMALVELTRPGPFRPRTIELGRYVGARHEGALIAMAGERLHLDGYSEISAVCTHPDHRGRGLGAGLTMAIADHIAARGETPMLHAASFNVNAIRIYERLGFKVRRNVAAVVLRAPEASPA
jgi:ribosomal protein S18 acetylase RimI-like enzyme